MTFRTARLARPGLWTAVALLLGLGLRSYHYGRRPSLWQDEAGTVVNVLQKDYAELLGPLYWAQAAPPLFLWAERAVVLALGDGPYALRLLPFLASCVALLQFRALAARLLPPWGAACAVLLFATSEQLLWHACEAKPYALDVLVATTFLYLHVRTASWPLGGRLVLHALLAPLFLALSYPAIFLSGSALLAYLPGVCRERGGRARLAYGLWALGVLATFAWLLAGPMKAQRCEALQSYWTGHLADWSRPWRVPLWAFASTLEVARYCYKPYGQVCAVLAAVGAVVWWRQGQRRWVVLLTLSLGLALAAGCLRRYPYGGSRLEVYWAPALGLLVGLGLGPTVGWLRGRRVWAAWVLGGALAATPLVGLYHAAVPWARHDCAGAAAYVLAHARPGDHILGNKWEYAYYFRHRPESFTLLEPEGLLKPPLPYARRLGQVPPPTRCWVVLSADSAAYRAQAVRGPGFDSRRKLAEQQFEGTTVYLFEEQAPPAPGQTLPDGPAGRAVFGPANP